MPLTKHDLLAQLAQERAAWEALLAEVGEQRMELPGVTGEWSMKDTIAHLTTWWRREVARLAAVQRGERPPDHPPQSDVAIINRWVQFTNRDRPLADVLRDAGAAWHEFEHRIGALPEERLVQRCDWLDGRPLGAGILHDFVEHLHEEHEPLIHSWLKQLNNR